ncbi:MAG TPA: YHYH protein [Verrucomicrobiae bacterium]|nr:YHYH protein [Verrucomicrobiae bacterium]
MKIKFALLLVLGIPAPAIFAHPGHEELPTWALAQLNASAQSAASTPESRVTIVTNGGYRIITANGLPDHAPGQFPNNGNPNRISEQSYTFRITLNSQTNSTLRRAQGAWFGVALNGVPFEPGTGEFWNGQREWNYEAMSGFIDLGLDQNNAHVQPTGAYHYHGLPTGLMAKLGGDGKKMLLVGYAADGFPIYTSYAHSVATNASSPLKKMRSSWQLKQGARPGGPNGNYDGRFTADYEFVSSSGDLDECNGRFGVTPEYPGGIYYYCITDEFPGLARSWRGTPDQSFFKSGPGPGGPNGPGGRQPRDRRIPGAPPPPRRG